MTTHDEPAELPHPPLARDASGNLLPVPDGTAAWRLCRHTRGRPRVVVGTDGEPVRFPLSMEPEGIVDVCGAGTYRVYALDEVGNLIDYVATIRAGVDTAPPEVAIAGVPRSIGTPPTSDLRFALEALTQMARTYADSLRAVTEAQADWVKTIAMAKGGLPRNVAAIPHVVEREDDDDGTTNEREDDAGSQEMEPPPRSGMEAFFQQLAPFVPELMASWNGRRPSPSRNADGGSGSDGASMVHLARIQAALDPRERRALSELLTDPAAPAIAAELGRRPLDEAVTWLRENWGGEREAPRPPSRGDAMDASLMRKLFEIVQRLAPDERARLMALRSRIAADPEYLLQLRVLLEPMTIDDAVDWVRTNLANLEARFAS